MVQRRRRCGRRKARKWLGVCCQDPGSTGPIIYSAPQLPGGTVYGANRPQDAVYPTSEGPKLLEKYNGANKYVLHFAKGEMPPVDGFWSVTMYNAQYFFVDNPLNRYNVSQRNKFITNADGSTDLVGSSGFAG